MESLKIEIYIKFGRKNSITCSTQFFFFWLSLLRDAGINHSSFILVLFLHSSCYKDKTTWWHWEKGKKVVELKFTPSASSPWAAYLYIHQNKLLSWDFIFGDFEFFFRLVLIPHNPSPVGTQCEIDIRCNEKVSHGARGIRQPRLTLLELRYSAFDDSVIEWKADLAHSCAISTKI